MNIWMLYMYCTAHTVPMPTQTNSISISNSFCLKHMTFRTLNTVYISVISLVCLNAQMCEYMHVNWDQEIKTKSSCWTDWKNVCTYVNMFIWESWQTEKEDACVCEKTLRVSMNTCERWQCGSEIEERATELQLNCRTEMTASEDQCVILKGC